MKPQTYWVVCRPTEDNPIDRIELDTISYTAEFALMKFMQPYSETWEEIRKLGYRCVKVNLTAI